MYRRDAFARVRQLALRLRTWARIKLRLGLKSMDDSAYTEWVRRYDTLDGNKRAALAELCNGFAHRPKISVLMPICSPIHNWLVEAIESVRNQIYPNWELCITVATSIDPSVRASLEDFSRKDKRIKLALVTAPGRFSIASNSALELATGEWIAWLGHNDILAETALCRVMEAFNLDSNAVFFYSDEDKVNSKGIRCEPLFKPDWSPHLACSQAYIGRLFVFKAIQAKPELEEDSVGSHDYALWLSITSKLKRNQIHHISCVLYHRRKGAYPTASITSSENRANLKALNRFISDRYCDETLYAKNGKSKFTYSLERRLGVEILISIIIPTKDKVDLLSDCIQSIRKKSTWHNFEIIIINNNSIEKSTFEYLDKIRAIDARITVVDAPIEFNWSRINNIGISRAHGDLYVFLNNDTLIVEGTWLEALSTYALLPDVGVVGGLLTYEDGSIQHSGVVVGMGGWADHIFCTQAATHASGTGFVSPVLTRNVLAVTGACMAISRRTIRSIGLFDENFVICGSDVEMCIRSHKYGYFNVMCAEARLFHFESKTRSSFVPAIDIEQSREKYAPYRKEKIDPFFNENLSLNTTYIRLKDSPVA